MIVVDINKFSNTLAMVRVWQPGTNVSVRKFVTPKSIPNFLQLMDTLYPELYLPGLDSLFSIDVSSMAHELPGIDQMVKHPVSGEPARLFDIIIDLNDQKKWSREQIADWIETLDDVPKFGAKNG